MPPGALTATTGTPCTKCKPLFPSNEPLPSSNALYVSQLPKVGMHVFPPLPRIRPFPQFGVKSHLFVKPGKSGCLPNDYRPISLTSCLCKLLERMVNFRLMWYLESKNLSPCQFGFRRARNTADPLTHIDTYIESAFARRESVLAVFLDLEKAYDTTWRSQILHQLPSLGLKSNMAFFIQSFLSHRSF